MPDTSRDKVSKLFDKRSKLEIELKRVQAAIEEALKKGDRRVKIEALVVQCQQILTSALQVNDEIFGFADKTAQKPEAREELERWVQEVTESNDVFLRNARVYLDQIPTDAPSSQEPASFRSCSMKSSKGNGCKSNRSGRTSKNSSQRRRDLQLALARREELERALEADLALTKQKQELELAQLKEAGRRKVTEAKLQELELQETSEEDEEEVPETGEDVAESVRDWIQSAPFGLQESSTPAISSGDLLTPNTDSNAVETVVDSNGQLPSNSATLPIATSELPANGILPTSAMTISGSEVSNASMTLTSLPVIPTSPATVRRVGRTPALPSGVYVCAAMPTGTSVVFTASNALTAPPSGPRATAAGSVFPTFSSAALATSSPLLPTSNTGFPPASHIVPNSSNWIFGSPSTILTSATHGSVGSHQTHHVTQHTSGGTVYFHYAPSVTDTNSKANNQFAAAGIASGNPNFQPRTTPVVDHSTNMNTAPVTLKDLGDLLAFSRRDPLPEWKLEKYDGDPLQWHEWFGQFKSAVDSASLTDDVKLTYLKTLTTGRAKTAIAQFAYCGAMYKDALRTLERKFGQPQAVVGAHLEKLASHPPVKIHNSDAIINYSATISSLVCVLQSLSFNEDLRSSNVLKQAVGKLPPNLREAWTSFVVRKQWVKPSLFEFSEWLAEKSEAHDLLKAVTPKQQTNDSQSSVVRSKTTTKTFTGNVGTKQNPSSKSTKDSKTESTCVVCKGKHPLWKCSVFREKTPTQRAKCVAENQLCFSCLTGKHISRNCPNPRKCNKENCEKTHNSLLHGAERVFSPNQKEKKQQPENNSAAAPGNLDLEGDLKCPAESAGFSSTIKVKGLLQLIEVEFLAQTAVVKALALCDSACSHSWMTRSLADRLNLRGQKLSVTVNGINSR